jgi:hypothetical protein
MVFLSKRPLNLLANSLTPRQDPPKSDHLPITKTRINNKKIIKITVPLIETKTNKDLQTNIKIMG